MMRTAVVFWLIMPMAASSAMMAEMRLRRRVAGDGDHVQPHRADAGHRFELFQRQGAAVARR